MSILYKFIQLLDARIQMANVLGDRLKANTIQYTHTAAAQIPCITPTGKITFIFNKTNIYVQGTIQDLIYKWVRQLHRVKIMLLSANTLITFTKHNY